MKCKVCNFDFILTKDRHYIVREDIVTGICNVARNEEPKLYDAFDCPDCGCQNIVGERYRPLKVIDFEDSIEDKAQNENPKDGADSSPEQYDYDREDILKKIAEAGEEYKVE